jgi:hypothetical protein
MTAFSREKVVGTATFAQRASEVLPFTAAQMRAAEQTSLTDSIRDNSCLVRLSARLT